MNTANNKSINDAKRRSRLQIFMVPTVLYAILYTVFLYKNHSSFASVLYVICATAYGIYTAKKLGRTFKPFSWVLSVFALLLAVSDGLTSNPLIVFLNNLAIYLIFILILIHNYNDDKEQGFFAHVILSISLIFGSLIRLFTPFGDLGYRSNASQNKKGRVKYILIGAAIAVPILAVIIALLSKADAVFAQVIRIDIDLSLGNIIGILLVFIFAYVSAYILSSHAFEENLTLGKGIPKKHDPVIGITIMSLVSVVYVIFCVIQVMYLFIGGFELPESFTYATYARNGFFQLLIVSIINAVMVLIFVRKFEKSKFLTVLLTFVSVLTYIIIASSAFRMVLYIRAYNLTISRVVVLFALAIIAVLLVGVIAKIYSKDYNMYKLAVITLLTAYTAFSLMRVDYVIASYNYDHGEYEYVLEQSADAAPVVAKFDITDPDQEYYKRNYFEDDLFKYRMERYRKGAIRSFNVGKEQAKNAYIKYLSEKYIDSDIIDIDE